MLSKCRIVVAFQLAGLQSWLLGEGCFGICFCLAYRLGFQNVELLSRSGFSKSLGCCQSVVMTALFGFLGFKAGSLERAVSGCFLCVRAVFGLHAIAKPSV